MDERMIKFIAALRASGVRISLAESEDAFHAVNEVGVKSKDVFRLGLRATLIKEARDLGAFDELFPLFFETADTPSLMDVTKDMTPEESKKLAQALRKFSEELRRMLEKLLNGEQLSREEMEQLSQFVGLDQTDDMRYRDWMTKRMEQALNFKEVREAIEELAQLLQEMGMNRERVEQLKQMMQANQKSLQDQLKQYAGQQIAENMSKQQREEGIDGLLNQPFSSLTEKDMDKLRKEVRRLAAALRTRISLRQKRAKSGQLDAKATLRANLKHNNVPIHLKHHDRTLKPKVVVVCDISTSMRYVSELMLNLLFSIQDQIRKTYAFAFIDHLEFITPDFDGKNMQAAVSNVLERMPSGYYNTDLGASLRKLSEDFIHTVDSRTIFIVVGDGRNNYNEPREDLFNELSRRSRKMIWLNPEPPALWGTGDSDMLKYAPACTNVFQVSNMAELTSAVDKMLSS